MLKPRMNIAVVLAWHVVALLEAGGTGWAQAPRPAAVSSGLADGGSLGLLLQRGQELELSDDQVRGLESLRTTLQKEAVRKGASIQLAELELAELQGSPADFATLEAKLREIEAARTQLRLAGVTAMEKASALLTAAQRKTLARLQKSWPPPSGVEGAADPTLRHQIQSALQEQLKDRNVVEVETTQAIVNRLTDLGKLLILFAAIPLGVLGFLGFRKFSDLSALVMAAEKEISGKLEHARDQFDSLGGQTDRLAFESQTIKQGAEALAERLKTIQADADKALQDISTATQMVALEGQKATLEIRTTAAAFHGQSVSASDSGVITIPVAVHVVYRTDEENISDAQIKSQLDVLNQDFRAKNPDISKVPEPFKEFVGDAQIEFVLATTDPLGNPTNGIIRTHTKRREFTSDDGTKASVKSASPAWDTERYLNIWVCTLGSGIVRYSQFPGGPKATDGVVVSNVAFGTVGRSMAPFNKGHTTTGGIGMFLNLRHIWGDTNDCTDADFVPDTPPQKGPNFGKPTFPHKSCPENAPHGDMFMNFMDYVDDDAMYMFTKGQALRMREALQGPRKKLRATQRAG